MSLPKSKYELEYDFRSDVSIVQLARILFIPTGPQLPQFLKKYKLDSAQQIQDLLCKKIIDAASTQDAVSIWLIGYNRFNKTVLFFFIHSLIKHCTMYVL